jgi:hypothetical protein
MINLSKKFPGYFNKWILKGVFVLCLILYILVLYLNNWIPYSVYVECNSTFGCDNPFVVCEYPAYPGIYQKEPLKQSCSNSSLCSLYPQYCSRSRMEPGEVIGKRSFFIDHFDMICLSLVALAFMINHLLWRVKNGKRNTN